MAFYTEELYGMGFAPGSLIQVLPEPGGGVVFNLCDENIRSYRELASSTRKKGGKLIQVTYTTVNDKIIPLLATYGHILSDGGFAIGDEVVIQCDCGVVRVRRPQRAIKLVRLARLTYRRTGHELAKLRLAGEWLADFGFVPDALLTGAVIDGSVVFELHDDGIEKYSGLVRHARQNGLKVIQVKTLRGHGKVPRTYPYIEVLGSWLDNVDFEIGEKVLAVCEKGLIKLQKPESVDLGF
jgi:hypothetical protein